MRRRGTNEPSFQPSSSAAGTMRSASHSRSRGSALSGWQLCTSSPASSWNVIRTPSGVVQPGSDSSTRCGRNRAPHCSARSSYADACGSCRAGSADAGAIFTTALRIPAGPAMFSRATVAPVYPALRHLRAGTDGVQPRPAPQRTSSAAVRGSSRYSASSSLIGGSDRSGPGGDRLIHIYAWAIFLVPVALGLAAGLTALAALARRSGPASTGGAPRCPQCGGTGIVVTDGGEEWPCLNTDYPHPHR